MKEKYRLTWDTFAAGQADVIDRHISRVTVATDTLNDDRTCVRGDV